MHQRDLRGALGDHLHVGHRRDHDLGAALGAVGIAARRQPRRRLDQAGEQRRFGERQLPRRLAEIALRRRLHPVGAGAEIDAVQIHFEDLRLAELVFEPERQHDFLQLAAERALLRQEQVLGELLRDGRAALRHAAVQHIGDDGAR